MAAPRERLILQSDWDQALCEEGGKAWITRQTADGPNTYGEIKTVAVSTNGVPYVSCSKNFSISNMTKKQVSLAYDNSSGCGLPQKQRFLAPHLSIYSVHTMNKSINSIHVTPGGLGVSCSSDETLKVWETGTGEVRRHLEGHLTEVTVCKFFPSGVVVLSGGADMQLKVWSAETGDCVSTLIGHTAGISGLAIVERGRNVLSSSRDGTVRLWDCGESKCIATFADIGSGVINGCAVGVTDVDLALPEQSPSEREVLTEGKLLLVACETGLLQAFGLQSRAKVFQVDGHGAVNCCTFVSPDTVAFGTQDGYITVIDIRNTSQPLAEWKESRSAILSLLPHKQGCFVSTGDGSCFYVNETYTTDLELTGPDCDPIYGMSIASGNVYTCCRDGAIRRYNVAAQA